MNSAKQARDLINALPRENLVKALSIVASGCELAARASGTAPVERFSVVSILDSGVEPYLRRIAPPDMDEAQLNLNANANANANDKASRAYFDCVRTLGGAYLICLRELRLDTARAGLAAVRTLRMLGQQAKWRLTRYQVVEERIWQELGDAYHLSESFGFAGRRVPHDSDAGQDTTARDEFLRALLLQVSATDSLSPAKTQIAEQLVALAAPNAILEATNTQDCPFYFNLARNQPPARVREGFASGPMMRYFSAGASEQMLRDIAKAVWSGEKETASFGLGQFQADSVIAVTQHLERYWGQASPQRRHARYPLQSEIHVTRGITAAVQRVRESTGGDTQGARATAGDERWSVIDTSDKGYGLNANLSEGALELGELLALRLEDSALYSVGVIRRLLFGRDEQFNAGVEVVGDIVIPVELWKWVDQVPAGETNQTTLALMIYDRSHEDVDVFVITAPGSFVAQTRYGMRVQGQHYVLESVSLAESGPDYDVIRFSILSAP